MPSAFFILSLNLCVQGGCIIRLPFQYIRQYIVRAKCGNSVHHHALTAKWPIQMGKECRLCYDVIRTNVLIPLHRFNLTHKLKENRRC